MLKKLLINLINIYQRCLRLGLPISCRFDPSCSEYAKQAILRYGVYAGALKAIRRISLCHPLSGRSGYDPLL